MHSPCEWKRSSLVPPATEAQSANCFQWVCRCLRHVLEVVPFRLQKSPSQAGCLSLRGTEHRQGGEGREIERCDISYRSGKHARTVPSVRPRANVHLPFKNNIVVVGLWFLHTLLTPAMFAVAARLAAAFSSPSPGPVEPRTPFSARFVSILLRSSITGGPSNCDAAPKINKIKLR